VFSITDHGTKLTYKAADGYQAEIPSTDYDKVCQHSSNRTTGPSRGFRTLSLANVFSKWNPLIVFKFLLIPSISPARVSIPVVVRARDLGLVPVGGLVREFGAVKCDGFRG
jgi:hypothetical protein